MDLTKLVGTFPHGIHKHLIALTDEQHPIKCNLHFALPAKSSRHLVNFTLQKQATHIANKCACDLKNRMVNTYDLQQPPDSATNARPNAVDENFNMLMATTIFACKNINAPIQIELNNKYLTCKLHLKEVKPMRIIPADNLSSSARLLNTSNCCVDDSTDLLHSEMHSDAENIPSTA